MRVVKETFCMITKTCKYIFMIVYVLYLHDDTTIIS